MLFDPVVVLSGIPYGVQNSANRCMYRQNPRLFLRSYAIVLVGHRAKSG